MLVAPAGLLPELGAHKGEKTDLVNTLNARRSDAGSPKRRRREDTFLPTLRPVREELPRKGNITSDLRDPELPEVFCNGQAPKVNNRKLVRMRYTSHSPRRHVVSVGGAGAVAPNFSQFRRAQSFAGGCSLQEVKVERCRAIDAWLAQAQRDFLLAERAKHQRRQEQQQRELMRVDKVNVKPLLRFKRAVKTIVTLQKATTSSGRDHVRNEAKLLSFAQYQDELLNNRRSYYGEGLTFDPYVFKAHQETHISNEAKTILTMNPSERTEDQLHLVLVSLNQAVEAFSEFPINMQESLVRVGWYEHFESKRVIIRQGHTADNFYFILSGAALVTILLTDKKTGEARANTVAILGKGNSFGELALMHGAKRSATVTCKDDVELLAVGREDFIDIFMHVEKDKEPEHIHFLRQVDILGGWPIHKLPYNDPKVCLFTYFRRGTVMCRDSNKAEWIYIIKSGSCQVLKSLQETRPNIVGLAQAEYRPLDDNKLLHPPTTSRSLCRPHAAGSLGDSNASLTTVCDVTSPREMSRRERQEMTTYSKGLPPIHRRSTEEIEQLLEQHRITLDRIYHDKHDQDASQRVRIRDKDQESGGQQTVFVQIQKLGSKETFGLEHVAFSLMGGCTTVSLVSDGAEAILINKRFFLQHLSDDMRKKLRVTIQPYPSEESLQQKLQNKSNWDAFKTMTVNDHVLFSKFVHDSLYF